MKYALLSLLALTCFGLYGYDANANVNTSTIVTESSYSHFRTVPNVQVVKTTTGQIRLNWSAISGATGYNIYHAQSALPYGSAGWSLLISLPADSLHYTINSASRTGFFYVTYNSGPVMPANFVFVQGGSFPLGSATMTVSSFYIDKYELLQGNYQFVMGTNPSHNYGVTPDRPVYYLSWFNTIEYCNRRSLIESLNPCYTYYGYGTNPDNWPPGWNTNDNNQALVECSWTANGYRLATEMEWMFAAKGGNESMGYLYSGSNDVNAVAWWGYFYGNGNSGYGCSPCGEKSSNELGIYDMSGNVNEWVWDRYGAYPTTSKTDYHGPNTGILHEFKGGCWIGVSENCQPTYRNFAGAADTIYQGVGFRVVRIAQ